MNFSIALADILKNQIHNPYLLLFVLIILWLVKEVKEIYNDEKIQIVARLDKQLEALGLLEVSIIDLLNNCNNESKNSLNNNISKSYPYITSSQIICLKKYLETSDIQVLNNFLLEMNKEIIQLKKEQEKRIQLVGNGSLNKFEYIVNNTIIPIIAPLFITFIIIITMIMVFALYFLYIDKYSSLGYLYATLVLSNVVFIAMIFFGTLDAISMQNIKNTLTNWSIFIASIILLSILSILCIKVWYGYGIIACFVCFLYLAYLFPKMKY